MDEIKIAKRFLRERDDREVSRTFKEALEAGLEQVPELEEVMLPFSGPIQGLGKLTSAEIAFMLFLLLEKNDAWDALLKEMRENPGRIKTLIPPQGDEHA